MKGIGAAVNRGRSDESGMTLIEMSVAFVIFAILSATVLSVTMTLMNTSNQSTHRFTNLGDAQPAMDVLTRDIRAAATYNGAGPVTTASPQSITVVSALGYAGGPTTITFTLSAAGTLTQTSVQPNTSGASTTATRVLSTHIVYPSGGATALFTYYDSNGNATTTASNVASVSINLVDNESPNIPAAATTLTAQVWIRNVIY